MKSFTITLAVLFATVSFAHATATEAAKGAQDQAVLETTTDVSTTTTTEEVPAVDASKEVAPAKKN